MKINELDKGGVTQQQLDALEKVLDQVFSKVGIDIEFTRHFVDRVNDERNIRPISIKELAMLFKKEFIKYGKPIAQLGPDAEAVMKDLESDINIPFALEWNGKELELIAKTVMRKKNFKTPNKEFAVENDNQSGVYKDEKNNVEIHWQRSNHPNVAKDYLDMEAYQNGKPVDINNQQADYYRYLINQEMNEKKIVEDFGSVPPLAELIIMAVAAKTTVDVLKGMFKVAIKTGKGINKLRKLQKKAQSIGQGVADYALGEATREELLTKVKDRQKEKFYQAALDALHRLVTSKGSKQSVGGYAFDIARAFNGIDPKELEKMYKQINEWGLARKQKVAKQSDPLTVLDTLSTRKDNAEFPIKFYDDEIIKVTPTQARRFMNAYLKMEHEKRDIIDKYIKTKKGFRQVIQTLDIREDAFDLLSAALDWDK